MPIENNTFDLVFSIGLLEHFSNIDTIISEQIRVLKPGGLFIGYVVPELKINIQKDFNWINDLLRIIYENEKHETDKKSEIYRSEALSEKYIKVLKKLNLKEIQTFGTYPLPMISYSPDFPFTLLPEKVEKKLTEIFSDWLNNIKEKNRRKSLEM